MVFPLTIRTKYTLGVLLVLIMLCLAWLWYQHRTRWVTVTVKNQAFVARLAETSRERTKGLSGTRVMARNEAMLFVFPQSGMHSFWMKDMYFPLDIIWISDDYKIVWIEKQVSPQTYPRSFVSQTPALFVLEISAGLSDEFGFAVGDSVSVEKVVEKK